MRPMLCSILLLSCTGEPEYGKEVPYTPDTSEPDEDSGEDGGDEDGGGDSGGDSGGEINLPPSAPVVGLYPPDATLSDDITCMVMEDSVDPEGDTVTYSYYWTHDNADANNDQADLSADLTERGTWTCQVTPNDGTQDGEVGTASTTLNPTCDDFSLSFDGGSDAVSFPYDASLDFGDGDFTIEFWFRQSDVHPADESETWVLLSDPGAFEIGYVYGGESPGGFQFCTPDCTSLDALLLSTDPIEDLDEWTHMAVTREETTMGLFVDKLHLQDLEWEGTMTSNGDGWIVGNRLDGESGWHGEIDQIHVSSVELYHSSYSPDEFIETDEDSKAFFGLGEGTGLTTTEDLLGLPGTITGAEWEPEAACSNAGPE